MSLPTVIVTGCLGRADILRIFDSVASDFNLHFIEYRHLGHELSQETYNKHGVLHKWDEFKSAEEILTTINPVLIIHLAQTSLTEVALRNAARKSGIRTVHLEHGFRFRTEHSERLNITLRNRRDLAWWRWWLDGKVEASVRNYSFVFRSAFELGLPIGARLLRYMVAVQQQNSLGKVLKESADFRRLDGYIAFSEETLAFHRENDALEGTGVYCSYVGIPQFDEFQINPASGRDPKAAVLIDHPNAALRWRGWTPEYASSWARDIKALCVQAGFQLYVKTHPLDTNNTWRPLQEPGVLEIIEWQQLNEVLKKTSIVMGFCSTLLLPFLAQPGVLGITLEMSPHPSTVMLSQPFIDAKIAEPGTSIEVLKELFERRDQLSQQQQQHKDAFVEQFLYALDGRSGERLRNTLLKIVRNEV